jgi:hypothetical protein
LPEIASGTVNPESMTGTAPSIQTTTVLSALNEALAKDDVNKLASCFFAEQAFWRDVVALTSHLRTFSGSSIIAAALRHLVELRGLEKKIQLIGNAKFSVMSPMLVSSFPLFFSPVLFHLKP